jgi:hypothetical protein
LARSLIHELSIFEITSHFFVVWLLMLPWYILRLIFTLSMTWLLKRNSKFNLFISMIGLLMCLLNLSHCLDLHFYDPSWIVNVLIKPLSSSWFTFIWFKLDMIAVFNFWRSIKTIWSNIILNLIICCSISIVFIILESIIQSSLGLDRINYLHPCIVHMYIFIIEKNTCQQQQQEYS